MSWQIGQGSIFGQITAFLEQVSSLKAFDFVELAILHLEQLFLPLFLMKTKQVWGGIP